MLAPRSLAWAARENEIKVIGIFTCQDVTISPATLIFGSCAWSNALFPGRANEDRGKLSKYAYSVIHSPPLSEGLGQLNRLNCSVISGSMRSENERSWKKLSTVQLEICLSCSCASVALASIHNWKHATIDVGQAPWKPRIVRLFSHCPKKFTCPLSSPRQ